MTDPSTRLKQLLFDKYGGFSDRRIKKISSGRLFIIDDRGANDRGADKQLYSWFCMMFAEVLDDQAVSVTLRRGVPKSESINQWVRTNGGTVEKAGDISLSVGPTNVEALNSLADTISAVIQRKYAVPAYKHVCPRTAASLRRLAAILTAYWGTK